MSRYNTLQDIFNVVWAHAKLGKRSAVSITEANETHTPICRYRMTINGEVRKCFIGCLIPDDQYTPALESAGFERAMLAADISQDVKKNDLFMLQRIHDDNEPNEWLRLLEGYAEEYHLTIPS